MTKTCEVKLEEAMKEIESLRERLEIGYAYNLDGERIQFNGPDGIECRNETISLLDREINKMLPLVRAAMEACTFDDESLWGEIAKFKAKSEHIEPK